MSNTATITLADQKSYTFELAPYTKEGNNNFFIRTYTLRTICNTQDEYQALNKPVLSSNTILEVVGYRKYLAVKIPESGAHYFINPLNVEYVGEEEFELHYGPTLSDKCESPKV